jgi:hypothetical protein
VSSVAGLLGEGRGKRQSAHRPSLRWGSSRGSGASTGMSITASPGTSHPSIREAHRDPCSRFQIFRVHRAEFTRQGVRGDSGNVSRKCRHVRRTLVEGGVAFGPDLEAHPVTLVLTMSRPVNVRKEGTVLSGSRTARAGRTRSSWSTMLRRDLSGAGADEIKGRAHRDIDRSGEPITEHQPRRRRRT